MKISPEAKKTLILAGIVIGSLIVYERAISPGVDWVAKKLNLPKIG